MTSPIRVLIVDDSALVRRALQELLEDGSGAFSVTASVPDPFAAARVLRDEIPDVLLLDLEMPKMDGVSFLRRLMSQCPIPTVIFSSLAKPGCALTLSALDAGAFEVLQKPALSSAELLRQTRVQIQDAVRSAAATSLSRIPLRAHQPEQPKSAPCATAAERVVLIGASTGGTEAIATVLAGLDAHCPGVAIVQHMPPGFTANFAKQLDRVGPLHVREAVDGDVLAAGQALLAPGDRHLELRRSGNQYYVVLSHGPPVNRHRPSVDVLFHSAAECAAANAIAVILTGMGADGADGMRALRNHGGRTIAQDEHSSVVYGMPCEALKRGGVEQVLPLASIASAVLGLARSPARLHSARPSHRAADAFPRTPK